MRILVSRSN